MITGRHAMDEFLFGSIGSIPEAAAEEREEDAEDDGVNGEPSIKTQQLLTFSSYVHQEVGAPRTMPASQVSSAAL